MTPPGDLVHYCVVRADLPRGLQAAQLIHAAGESALPFMPRHTFAVALHVPGEPELLWLARALAKAGIDHHRVIEDDAPYTNHLMALGIRPMSRRILRPFLADLKLVT